VQIGSAAGCRGQNGRCSSMFIPFRKIQLWDENARGA
jgi:hypothetical protein